MPRIRFSDVWLRKQPAQQPWSASETCPTLRAVGTLFDRIDTRGIVCKRACVRYWDWVRLAKDYPEKSLFPVCHLLAKVIQSSDAYRPLTPKSTSDSLLLRSIEQVVWACKFFVEAKADAGTAMWFCHRNVLRECLDSVKDDLTVLPSLLERENYRGAANTCKELLGLIMKTAPSDYRFTYATVGEEGVVLIPAADNGQDFQEWAYSWHLVKSLDCQNQPPDGWASQLERLTNYYPFACAAIMRNILQAIEPIRMILAKERQRAGETPGRPGEREEHGGSKEQPSRTAQPEVKLKRWKPPKNYTGAKSTGIPRSTLEGWEQQDDAPGQPLNGKVKQDPSTREKYYPDSWLKKRKARHKPRKKSP